MRVITIIPTYNELESLPLTVGRLRSAVPDSDVLIVDDNSPDGTGLRADELAAADDRIHVLHRGSIVHSGGAEVAAAIDADGYAPFVGADAGADLR